MSEFERMSLDVLRADRSIFSQELILASLSAECNELGDNNDMSAGTKNLSSLATRTDSEATIISTLQQVPNKEYNTYTQRNDSDKRAGKRVNKPSSGGSIGGVNKSKAQ